MTKQRKLPEEDEMEKIKEREVLPIINNLKNTTTSDEVFQHNYPIEWKLSNNIQLFGDITWSEMKKYYNWGFASGKCISNYIDWIYIRPDVANGLLSDIIGGSEGLIRKGILDKHYFIVKTKAVNYFLSKCSKLLKRPRRINTSSSDEEDKNEKDEEVKRRRGLSKYFYDEAKDISRDNNL